MKFIAPLIGELLSALLVVDCWPHLQEPHSQLSFSQGQRIIAAAEDRGESLVGCTAIEVSRDIHRESAKLWRSLEVSFISIGSLWLSIIEFSFWGQSRTTRSASVFRLDPLSCFPIKKLWTDLNQKSSGVINSFSNWWGINKIYQSHTQNHTQRLIFLT